VVEAPGQRIGRWQPVVQGLGVVLVSAGLVTPVGGEFPWLHRLPGPTHDGVVVGVHGCHDGLLLDVYTGTASLTGHGNGWQTAAARSWSTRTRLRPRSCATRPILG